MDLALSARPVESNLPTPVFKGEGESLRAPGRLWPIPRKGACFLSGLLSESKLEPFADIAKLPGRRGGGCGFSGSSAEDAGDLPFA